jgi:hypothetical protein
LIKKEIFNLYFKPLISKFGTLLQENSNISAFDLKPMVFLPLENKSLNGWRFYFYCTEKLYSFFLMSKQLINIKLMEWLVRSKGMIQRIFEVYCLCFCHFVWILSPRVTNACNSLIPKSIRMPKDSDHTWCNAWRSAPTFLDLSDLRKICTVWP